MGNHKYENKLVYGVGVCDEGVYKPYVLGKVTKEYCLWKHMLERCYSEKYHSNHPTYTNCSVSVNFKNFQYFAEWTNNQIGFGLKDYALDKDILVKGNKIYCENNCVFVPRQLNAFLTNSKAIRGNYPVGVSKHKNKYRSFISLENKSKHLGTSNTPEEAFEAYKAFKESYAKQLALEHEGFVDPRVITSLNNYEVNIDD